MSEFRRHSIVDQITPLQIQAWTEENLALKVTADGYGAFANYHKELAASYRWDDTHNKIQELFSRLDAQNALLDGIAEARDSDHDIPIFEPQVDYTLMQQ